ncbi:reverse transcriptase [Elysia marginata]|uniref:Reverse transcriptase n=1 Tax=Elysia marginata TaxID=1093978 RepID=A0AAV4J929_9GAST|nr:reverse transcriptase [Elysia marginata]
MCYGNARFKFPKSILKECKCGKARLDAMLENSDDPEVKAVTPSINIHRMWKVTRAIGEAKKCLNMKEVIGQTQTDRKGLGSSKAKGWSKTEGKEKRDMTIDKVRQEEFEKNFEGRPATSQTEILQSTDSNME